MSCLTQQEGVLQKQHLPSNHDSTADSAGVSCTDVVVRIFANCCRYKPVW